jgi:hypothetical protein
MSVITYINVYSVMCSVVTDLVHTATLAATCETPTSLSVLAQLKPYQLNHSISVPKLCSVTLCFGRSTACMNHTKTRHII